MSRTRQQRTRGLHLAASVAIALFIGGCAVHPVPVAETEHQERAKNDYIKLFAAQEELTSSLTVSEATARAIHYNMDYRVRLMEEAVALGQNELANFDLLPRLTATAGYTTRDNNSFGFGFGPDGRISANPTSSQERTRHTYNISFAWNLLDFGMSYVRAKQLADQALIAEERRRKALQNLVQDVRFAWWRAESAQRLLPEIDAMLDEIEQSASRASFIETRRLLPPLQIVAYRRSLLDLEQQLSFKRQELAQAVIELSSLINMRPGASFRIALVKEDDLTVPELRADVGTLETVALENRPELREEAYKARLTDNEWKKQVLSLLPNFGMDIGPNYDSNRFLINNQWVSAGLNFSFGLLKLFSLPAAQRATDAQRNADEVRRLAVAAAVIAQTRMAAVRYQLLMHEYGVWQAAARDDARLVEYLRASREVGLETELELIRARARAMLSRIQRDVVHANLQSAMARLYNSLGLDSVPREINNRDLSTLATMLDRQIGDWQDKNFSDPAVPRLAPVTVRHADGLPADAIEPFETAFHRTLRLSKVPVSTDEGGFTLSTTVRFDKPQKGGRPSILTMTVQDADGKVLVDARQKSVLVEPMTREQWEAFGESAAYRIVEPLRKLLHRPAHADNTAGRDVRGDAGGLHPELRPVGGVN